MIYNSPNKRKSFLQLIKNQNYIHRLISFPLSLLVTWKALSSFQKYRHFSLILLCSLLQTSHKKSFFWNSNNSQDIIFSFIKNFVLLISLTKIKLLSPRYIVLFKVYITLQSWLIVQDQNYIFNQYYRSQRNISLPIKFYKYWIKLCKPSISSHVSSIPHFIIFHNLASKIH